MFNIKGNIVSKNLQELVVPLVFLLIVCAGFVVGTKYIFLRVLSVRDQLAEANKRENTLAQKESILKEEKDKLPFYSESLSLALPFSNPSLAVLSALRSLALENGLVLTNPSVSEVRSSSASGLLKVSIVATLNGRTEDILSFVNGTDAILPLVFPVSIEISAKAENPKADIVLESYWITSPREIPPADSGIVAISSGEIEILTSLSGKRAIAPSQFVPFENGSRENPFSL